LALIRAVALSLLLAACATGARAQDAMAPFAPLMGCWRGAFDGNAAIHDERCFEPMLEGRYVRDTHFVRPTTYGGISAGGVRVEEGALVFDAHTYTGADGATQRLRSRWTIEGRDRLVVVSEREIEGAWRPWGRITYTRAR